MTTPTLLLEGIPTCAEVAEQLIAVAAEAEVTYTMGPHPELNYVTLNADFNQDFRPVRQAFEARFGPVHDLNHIAETGEIDDGEFDDDDTFEGFKVGPVVVQFERNSEEFIQIFPSAADIGT